MFWDSITEGLSILSHWQIWAAVIVYAVVNNVALIVSGLIAGDESGGRQAAGCLFWLIGGTILQAAMAGLLIAYLLPLLLGGEEANTLSEIFSAIWPLTKASGIACLTVIGLTLIPVAGQIVAHSPGIQSFLVCVIIFRLLVADGIEQLIQGNDLWSVYPGFWQSAAYFLIASALIWITNIVFAYLMVLLEERGYDLSSILGLVVAPIIGVLVGLLPLFMYASYVQLAVRDALAK